MIPDTLPGRNAPHPRGCLEKPYFIDNLRERKKIKPQLKQILELESTRNRPLKKRKTSVPLEKKKNLEMVCSELFCSLILTLIFMKSVIDLNIFLGGRSCSNLS